MERSNRSKRPADLDAVDTHAAACATHGSHPGRSACGRHGGTQERHGRDAVSDMHIFGKKPDYDP